ncbi:MAG TPA: hypothetical protein VG890_10205 [Puia sp.]|nr:hypothetical protein [Puia sp.]
MLEEELKEAADHQQSVKNLKYALLALGYAILSGLASYIAIDSFSPGAGLFWIRVMIGIYYLLTIVSVIYAFLACRDSVKSLRTNKNYRNYIALAIGVLLLLGVCRQILSLM